MRHVRELAVGNGYRTGEFHCPPGSPRWSELNWIGDHPHIVIPSTSVGITPAGQERHVSTPNHVLVYDPDVHYQRQLISAAGDVCVFIELGAELAHEIPSAPRQAAPGVRAVPIPALAYARLHLTREESVLDLVVSVGAGLGKPPPVRLGRQQRRAVEQLKQTLAGPGNENLTLAEYAAGVHYSPFALARMFRWYTGYSIGEFRRQLRLRASLREVLAAQRDLSAVAAGYGFSSHSHYTSAFRRAFGITPSQAQARARARARQVDLR